MFAKLTPVKSRQFSGVSRKKNISLLEISNNPNSGFNLYALLPCPKCIFKSVLRSLEAPPRCLEFWHILRALSSLIRYA